VSTPLVGARGVVEGRDPQDQPSQQSQSPRAWLGGPKGAVGPG
jgi:hypothetical protein